MTTSGSPQPARAIGDAYMVRLPVSARLFAAFLLVTVPALAVMAALSLYTLRELAGANHELQEISRSLEAVQALETAVAKTITPLSAFLVDGAPAEARRFDTVLQDVEMRLRSCGGAACHGISQQPRAMAESLAPYLRAIKNRAASIFGSGEPLPEQAKVRMLHEISRQGEETNGRLQKMSSTLLARVASLQGKSEEVSRRAVTLTIVTVLLVVSLAAVSAWFLSRRLLKPVGDLLAGTRHIMQGDLKHRVAETRDDEIGQLARSFNAMAQELQGHRERLEQIVAARTAELRRAQDSLVQSEKLAAIGLLAAGVAHELNNPLTSILMNVNLLMEDAGSDPALRAELQRIGEDTVRCKRIIDDLRNFSRRHELDIVPTDLNALVERALGALDRTIATQGIAVTRELSAELPRIPCDPARMEQVLGNVLVNAFQAMPQGGRLVVRTKLRSERAEILIQDSGTGIADAIRERIFDPFFTTKPQGTGLGLAIVFSIMEAHGGRIEVENVTREGSLANASDSAGTRVRLLLPLEGGASGQTGGAVRPNLNMGRSL
jgi:signal transduction histidine kinase